MRVFLALATFVLATDSLRAQENGLTAGDFGLGRALAHCLIAKCQVFSGFLQTETPISGEPVPVLVDKVIFGPALSLGTVSVPYAEPNDPRMSAVSPNRAWRGVTFSRSGPVTVALAQEKIMDVKPGYPVAVTSNERVAAIIRSLVAEAVRLRSAPESVSESVGSLSRRPDQALAGFLYTYIGRSLIIANPELGSTLLGQFIGSPSVPARVWDEIAAYTTAEYYRLAVPERSAMVRRFSELALNADLRASAAAFRGLGKIGSFDDSVWDMVPQNSLRSLGTAYRGVVQKGNLPRNPSLEKALGIQY